MDKTTTTLFFMCLWVVCAAFGCDGGGDLPSHSTDTMRAATDVEEDSSGEADVAPDTSLEQGFDVGAADVEDDTGVEPSDTGVEPVDALPERALRVLFVGNSYTTTNDLPAVVREIAAATSEVAIETENATRGGAHLYQHWETDNVQERIATGAFDVVVFQGQSLEPIELGGAFRVYAQMFADVANEAQARAVWFSTWPRRADHAWYRENMLGVSTPERANGWIEGTYGYAAHWHRDFVARVGAAWLLALDELPEVELYTADGSHPSRFGTLLSACVLYQAITGQAPELPDPAPLQLPNDVARQLCALAPRVACAGGYTLCEGRCVQLSTDFDHCGACGNACGEMEPCREGVCGCAPEQDACARRCTDVRVDARHCGACGNLCADAQLCVEGQCVCPNAAALTIQDGTLSALEPNCASAVVEPHPDCGRAAHLFCAEHPCFSSGLGPLRVPGMGPSVMCFPYAPTPASFVELSMVEPLCDGMGERTGPDCAAAAHRFCQAQGAAAGLGPIDDGTDVPDVICLPDAEVVQTDFAELGAFLFQCDGVMERGGIGCSIASWFLCADRGYGAGFGPVVIDGDDVEVVCYDL